MLPLTDATTIEKKVIRPIAIVIKLYSLPPLVLIQLVAVPDKDKPINDNPIVENNNKTIENNNEEPIVEDDKGLEIIKDAKVNGDIIINEENNERKQEDMKNEFQTPTTEVVEFETEDVITTSGNPTPTVPDPGAGE